MLFLVALLVWFALSVPAALLIGRMLSASGRRLEAPAPERPLPRREHAFAGR